MSNQDFYRLYYSSKNNGQGCQQMRGIPIVTCPKPATGLVDYFKRYFPFPDKDQEQICLQTKVSEEKFVAPPRQKKQKPITTNYSVKPFYPPSYYLDLSASSIGERPVVGSSGNKTAPEMLYTNKRNLPNRKFKCSQPSWSCDCI